MKFIRFLISFGVLTVMGIVLLTASLKDKAELAKPRGIIEEMRAADYYDGRFVEGTIYELWDNYAYLEESDSTFGIKYNTKVTAQYFAMPVVDEDKFIFAAVSFRNSSDISTAEKMAKETDDYYINDKEPAVWTEMHVAGKVTKLSGDDLNHLKNYVIGQGGSDENVCPYVIHVGNTGSDLTIVMILAIALTVIGVGGIVFRIIRKVISGK